MDFTFDKITYRALTAMGDLYEWGVVNNVNIDILENIEKIKDAIKNVKSDIHEEWLEKCESGQIIYDG